MKKTSKTGRLVALLLLVVMAAFVPASAQRSTNAKQTKARERVLVLSLDGLDFRYLKQADALGLKIPNLRRLMANGVSAPVYGVYPSHTYPSHTTMVTGVAPDRHGIFGNNKIEPLDQRQGDLYFFADLIQADTLWDAARRGGLKVGSVSWPVGVGSGDFNVPEIFRSGNTQMQNLELMKNTGVPRGLVDEAMAQRPTLFAGVTADEQDGMRTGFAEYIIETKKPELMLVHIFDFDHYQHDAGPFTAESMAILEKSDEYLGRLLAAAERAGTLAQTNVFVVSDHGFLPVKKQINPGVALARAGLITTRETKNAQGQTRTEVTEWKIMPYATGGSCSFILKDPGDLATLQKARTVLNQLAAESDEGKSNGGAKRFSVLSASQMRKQHVNPKAVIALEANDGYIFGSNVYGPATVDSRQKGQHGYSPNKYEASFIASGPAVTGRGMRRQIRMVQVGPTIARVLGIKLRDARSGPVSLR